MDLKDKTIGFAMTGSFCTFSKALKALEELKSTGCDIIPIMSEIAYKSDTRFGRCETFKTAIKDICGHEIISRVQEAEPIGPKKLLDLLVILPCTGNSIAKLAAGIADTSVTMAAKAHLRNDRPILIGISTNDALGNAAKNIGALLNAKNIYFIPFGQDDYKKKPNSLVADFSLLVPAAEAALKKTQLQPILK
ncbi:MAG: dipicolinate synthase subunit B [Clostridiales bacterium]|nr:dipicolinate synthase subunit B [Clostridiales bacterium]